MKLIITLIFSIMVGNFSSAFAETQETKKFGLPPFYNTKDAIKNLETLPSFGQMTISIEENENKISPLNLVYSGDKKQPMILFIHGSPGSWNAWANYLDDPDLQKKFFMVAVDRPGFGKSNDGSSGKTLKDQVKLIMTAVNKFAPEKKNFIIIGHSYGGPIALRLAIDYPNYTKSMILLAPAISPELTKKKWYNNAASLLLVRAILPNNLQHSNDEMVPLKSELMKMQPSLKNIKAPTSVIQGKKDGLVPYGNAAFAKQALTNAKVDIKLLEERGHFIPWEEYDLVKKTIIEHGR